jgi:hypothetical protein
VVKRKVVGEMVCPCSSSSCRVSAIAWPIEFALTSSISDKILMPLARRSRVVETGGASPADVVVTWRGLSPWTRLTLESAPVGYSGLPPFRARISDS